MKILIDKAWSNKLCVDFEYKDKRFLIYYIGIKELIKNKEAVNRYKDKDDLRFLNEIIKRK